MCAASQTIAVKTKVVKESKKISSAEVSAGGTGVLPPRDVPEALSPVGNRPRWVLGSMQCGIVVVGRVRVCGVIRVSIAQRLHYPSVPKSAF